MNQESAIPKRFFDLSGYDLSSVGKLREALQQGADFYMGWVNSVERDLPLPAEDVEVVRSYVGHEDSGIRAVLAKMLAQEGSITWEDLEAWLMDPDINVREETAFALSMSFFSAGSLCRTDKKRCAHLLAASAERYHSLSVEAWSLSRDDDEWLDAFWPEVERLLDLGDEDLYYNIVCGFLEDVLRYRHFGPDDPHIKPWIESCSVERKMALLGVAGWLGINDPKLHGIADALVHDDSAEVSNTAKAILATPQSEYRGPRH